MSDTSRCPYCGSPRAVPGVDSAGVPGPRQNGHAPERPVAVNGHGTAERALDSLYQEVRRIRELAETRPAPAAPASAMAASAMAASAMAASAAAAPPAGPLPAPRAADDGQRRIEELTREVQELRVTVARLRGAPASAARSG